VVQKVVLWFREGQKYQFLSYYLPSVCPLPETILQIKHWTTEVLLSFLSFFSKSNAPYSFLEGGYELDTFELIVVDIGLSI